MYIAAEIRSILLDVSAAISVENCIGSTWTWKPASLPTSVTRSTITPWIVLVLVSRKVKGMPVGVEPTLRIDWACAGATDAASAAAMTKPRMLFISHTPPRDNSDEPLLRGVEHEC